MAQGASLDVEHGCILENLFSEPFSLNPSKHMTEKLLPKLFLLYIVSVTGFIKYHMWNSNFVAFWRTLILMYKKCDYLDTSWQKYIEDQKDNYSFNFQKISKCDVRWLLDCTVSTTGPVYRKYMLVKLFGTISATSVQFLTNTLYSPYRFRDL